MSIPIQNFDTENYRGYGLIAPQFCSFLVISSEPLDKLNESLRLVLKFVWLKICEFILAFRSRDLAAWRLCRRLCTPRLCTARRLCTLKLIKHSTRWLCLSQNLMQVMLINTTTAYQNMFTSFWFIYMPF